MIAACCVAFFLALTDVAHAEIIQCDGDYGGHLQGITVDGAGLIYWSFTVDLVKTDRTGKVLAHITAPSHHGDLTVDDGKLYVAVNLGDFNKEPGYAHHGFIFTTRAICR